MTATAEQQFHEAALHEWQWKTPAMREMTLAICRVALRTADGGGQMAEFSANDLPEFDHGGSGIAGTAFKLLINDGVLARVGLFEGDEFCQKTVHNAGGNRIGVYRLRNGALARRALEIHGQPVAEAKQLEFA